MARRKKPQIIITHHRVEPPKYTVAEIEGLRDQASRIEKHIDILEEEIKIKKAELVGIKSLLG